MDGSAGPDACWPWTGKTNGYRFGAYGQVYIGRTGDGKPRYAYAHRLALEEKLGRDLAPGEMALHDCNNSLCCNPAHLRVGTHADNMADLRASGRRRVRHLRCVDCGKFGHDVCGSVAAVAL